MRVTNMMMINTMNYNIGKNLSNMSDQYVQMSTGKSFQTPSDDPVAASKSVLYTSELSEIEQYQSNAADGTARLTVAESSIDSLEDILERTRELTVQASNETLSDTDKEAIEAEIIELNKQLMEISNTTYAGESIFGGYNVTSEPYVKNSDGVLLYNGSATSLTGPYSSGMSDADLLTLYGTYNADQQTSTDSDQNMIFKIGDSSEVDVNVEGQELFGIGEDSVFAVMEKIEMAMSGETSYKKIVETPPPATVVEEPLEMTELIGELDQALDNVRAVKAEVGAKNQYVTMTSKRLEQDFYTYTELLSTNEDADIAQVSMELANAESVYNASLSAGAKIIVPTLADFLL